MKKKELIITVSGQTASGKSRLIYLLKNFLREQGFDVEFEGNIEHSTECDFDNYMSRNIDEAIGNIKDSRKITLKEVQLPFVMI